MRCLRTRGLVRWDGRRAQGGGSDWYSHHGVRWGSSLTPNGSGMRIDAATCPTVIPPTWSRVLGVAPGREEGKGLEVGREWQDALGTSESG